MGEATETALVVLVEKMNVYGQDLSRLNKAEKETLTFDAKDCDDLLETFNFNSDKFIFLNGCC